MAIDEKLAERVRAAIGKRRGLTEQKMFGGVGLMLNGNLCCGASDRGLLLRIDPDDTDKVAAMPHASIMTMKGRPPMRGWIRVDSGGLKTPAQIKKWVAMGVAYAGSLPPKR
jgi:TfoX/Sxy family transcriptional regulator of competence genes